MPIPPVNDVAPRQRKFAQFFVCGCIGGLALQTAVRAWTICSQDANGQPTSSTTSSHFGRLPAIEMSSSQILQSCHFGNDAYPCASCHITAGGEKAIFDLRCVDLTASSYAGGNGNGPLMVVETQSPLVLNNNFQFRALTSDGSYNQLAQTSLSVFGPHVDTICFALQKAYVPNPQKAWFFEGEMHPLFSSTWHGVYFTDALAHQNGFVVELKVFATDVTRTWKVGVLAQLCLLMTEVGGNISVIAMIFLALFMRQHPLSPDRQRERTLVLRFCCHRATDDKVAELLG